MHNDTVLSVNNLSFSYEENKPLLHEINLQVKSHEIISISGPNGVGKSTLLKAFVGLIDFEGKLLFRNNQVVNFEDYKRKIAYLPSTPLVYNILTGNEYLNLIRSIWNTSKDLFRENVNFYSEKLSMSKHLETRIEEYSDGMRDKLFFIANISRNPEIVFLDEPFLSWDFNSQQVVIQLLRQYVEKYNKAVILVTHSKQIREQLADKKYEIKDYTLVKDIE